MADDGTKTPGLESAYSLQGPEDSRRLYADWAETYDSGFVREMGYRLPQEVAQAYHALAEEGGADGPVLDLGAGTGLVGAALAARGVGPLEGTDISAEMLAQAEAKGVYTRLFEGDLTARLPVEDDAYAGAVSAGTFTNGHVGPEALGEVLRVVRPGGWVVLSVNMRHWAAQRFEEVLAERAAQIAARADTEVAVYAPGADGPHATDTARILALKKA
jgi:predicted TPR repeat methyltransferase